MRVTGAGHLVFALAIMSIGLWGLCSGDFAPEWQPVPASLPFREILAYVSGGVLVICSLGTLVPRTAPLCAAVLTVDFLSWLMLLRLPAVKSWLDEGGWLGVGETAVLVASAWTLLIVVLHDRKPPLGAFLLGASGLRMARIMLGVALPLIGLSHFVFLKMASDMIPSYFPARESLSILTGACHIAAGLAILVSVLPRLAATMEGIMMVLFGLNVWLPKAVMAPGSRFYWTAMLISFAYGGGVLIVADACKKRTPDGRQSAA